ncbi:MAG: GNAT family N-acetyltransferase [Deltaproteobacteria bacterium]|nr:GNAT family N-acetyltransferase [Deltaproteobacteria bacterium]
MAQELSADEILVEVVERPRRAFVPIDDLRVIERPGWMQLITPSFPDGGFNEVAHAVLAPGEADAVIARTIAEYRRLGIKFRWVVGPGSAPADLGDRLVRAGLIRSSAAHGMVRSTAPPLVAPDPAITVEPVEPSNVGAYTAVMAEGWGIAPGPLGRAHDLALASTDHRLALARIDGEPAGAAGGVAFPRSLYLMGGVVLPRFRRRGVYHALVAARLAAASARGIGLVTARAQVATSAPVLQRLGFRTVCAFTSYNNFR